MGKSLNGTGQTEYSDLGIDLTEEDKNLLAKISSLSAHDYNVKIKSIAMARYFKKRYLEGARVDIIRSEMLERFNIKNDAYLTYFFNSRELKKVIEKETKKG